MDINIYSNYIYLDTNIFSHLVNDISSRNRLKSYLISNNISLALTDAHFAELSDAYRKHEVLSEILLSLPSSILFNWDKLLECEVKAHPSFYTGSILSYPLNNIINEGEGAEKILSFLRSDALAFARKQQKESSTKMLERYRELKNNFPSAENGKYSVSQVKQFEFLMVIQWLGEVNSTFLAKYKNDLSSLNVKTFKSIRLDALYLYYKYYLGNREPKELSDFGDFFHLCTIPYCKIAVVERDMCEIFNQIKKHNDILEDVSVYNLEFIKNL